MELAKDEIESVNNLNSDEDGDDESKPIEDSD